MEVHQIQCEFMCSAAKESIERKNFAKITLMKRNSTSVDATDMFMSRRQLAQAYCITEDPGLFHMIENNINLVFDVKKRRDPTVTVYYPELRLLTLTQEFAPKISTETVWNGNIGEYEHHLILKWEFDELGVVSKILGDCLSPKIYPDSKGRVDFKNFSGGKFIVDVSKSKPITLKYRVYTSSLSINFHYSMHKAFFKDNEVYFEKVL